MENEFTYYDQNAANPEVRKIMTDFKEEVGFIPNILAAIGESPEALKAYMAMAELLSQSSLTSEERHVVWLTVCYENQSAYGMAIHSMYARKVREGKLPDEDIRALREGDVLRDEKLQALRVFTQKLIETRGRLEPECLEHFLAADYTRKNVFEIILAISMKTLTDYSSNLLDTPVDDIALNDQWEIPRT